MARLIWIGVACCIGALGLNLFPALVYELGMDRVGAWSFFGFGLFLILMGTLLARSGKCEHAPRPSR
jgi:hypothetical protein